jgi:hypothetical protein
MVVCNVACDIDGYRPMSVSTSSGIFCVLSPCSSCPRPTVRPSASLAWLLTACSSSAQMHKLYKIKRAQRFDLIAT